MQLEKFPIVSADYAIQLASGQRGAADDTFLAERLRARSRESRILPAVVKRGRRCFDLLSMGGDCGDLWIVDGLSRWPENAH